MSIRPNLQFVLLIIPTGIVVSCQNERSQVQNRQVAMRMLMSKLMEIKEREHYDKIEDIKGEQKKIEWGSQIRSYVFMPYTLVKDHRTGFENGNINAVWWVHIDGLHFAYLKMTPLKMGQMLNAAVTNRRLPRKRFFIKIVVQLAGLGPGKLFVSERFT